MWSTSLGADVYQVLLERREVCRLPRTSCSRVRRNANACGRGCALTIVAAAIFTVAEARDLLGTSRKYALALLEFLDQQGITVRRGDERVLKGVPR